MLRKFIATLAFFAAAPLVAQEKDSLSLVIRDAEWELAQIQGAAFHSRTEKERIDGIKSFIGVWDRIADNPAVLTHEFTSLKDVSILDSRDRKLRLVTWNHHRDDGTHVYFGYLFVNNVKKVKRSWLRSERVREFEHFKLVDRSMTVKNPETYTGSPDKWFGMLYTQVIDCGDYYTLLGWDGNDRLTQRKFIDVLYFKEDGTPVFGKDVFKFPRRNPRRLMFECSSEVSMSLRYQEKSKQIVYSHLAPRQEGELLEGQYQFYGPDGSFDALELHKDKWVLVEDIDARNSKSPNDNVTKPDPKRQKPLYAPK
jgi:hypothetical protein